MIYVDTPVVRKTRHIAHNKELVVTITPGGVHLRLLGTQQTHTVDYLTLWRWVQSDGISIKPRR